MMLQACACPWSLIVPSPLCHGIKADYHQPQILLNPGCASSQKHVIPGDLIMECCHRHRLRAAHTSPVSAEGADGPQHTDFNHFSTLEGHIPDSVQSVHVQLWVCWSNSSSDSMRPQSFCFHSVRYSSNPVSKKKVNIPFQEAELQAIPCQTIPLFLFWKLCLLLSFGFLQGLKCPGPDSDRHVLRSVSAMGCPHFLLHAVLC